MSRTYKDSPNGKRRGPGRQRNISVRAVRRDPPDLRKLSRALISLATAEAAAEAAAEQPDAVQAADQPDAEPAGQPSPGKDEDDRV
ncbi:MAG TPA: hypothetical protein VF557_07740 [Jatrophihabitans sp.]|jgi:hypothetical protein|uniref:hypothetical protein n=1 Tax=Jatrophihabitans sp. TaxID=1932789 RepID=UPI002EE8430E